MKKKRNLKSDPLKPFPPTNPTRRRAHKQALVDAKHEAEQNRLHPEPMSLMHKRVKDHSVPDDAAANISLYRCGKVYCPPEVSKGQIAQAAQAMAAWDNSNPFAYGRTVLHVTRGYLRSDEIVKEAWQRAMQRRAARVKEVDDAK